MKNPYQFQQNTIVVAKSGGQFTTIQGAIDSVTDASAVNRYTFDIHPGIYLENVVLGDYMALVGRGSAFDVIILSVSGTTMTLPANASFLSNLFVVMNPTASGSKAIDAPNGGSHTIFFCGVQNESATNGITGSCISMASDSIITFVEGLTDYSFTGSAVGSNTHNVIDMQGTSTLRYLRSDLTATLGDVDDDINLILDNSTGIFQQATVQHTLNITNAAYSGIANTYNFTKNGSAIRLTSNTIIQMIGAGSGTANAYKIDSDVDSAIIDAAFSKVLVTGFAVNRFADVSTGDVLNSQSSFITAADDITGAGEINFINSNEYGQIEITGGGLFTIDDSNEWHAFSTPTTGLNSDNVEVEVGSTGAITVFADAGGGQVTVTSNSHGLLEDHYITITGTTNYNGVFQITNVTTNTFEITDTWVADDATGTWNFGSSIVARHRGAYSINWSFSSSSASVNQTFDFVVFNGTSEIAGTKITRKFSTAGDVGAMAGVGVVFLEKDDHLWFAMRNNSSAGNITISEGALNISKIS